jgi:type IV secretory pathway VirD2 relaxase
MAQDDFKPKLGRMRDAGRTRLTKHTTRVFRQAGKAGVRALRQKGHVSPSALKRGMGTGVRAAAGLIAPGSRRVIVKARYTRIVAGDLGAARAHIKYILRDGVTREGMPGHLYDASHDEVDGTDFLARSERDPHQFRFIVSPEDSARLADLKPFVRDLLSQMERDLETKLDWVAVDHFNTGHPHTHVVIRGRDDQGRDLVMARDYISHGVRARAQGLITLELGPETNLERTQKLFNETGQERLTRLDRALLARARDGILVVTTVEEQDPVQQTLRIGRLKTLERLGLAEERQQGVWQVDGKLESKLRRLGDRADKFRTMQQVLKELGIDRNAAAMALFERGPRKAPLIGKVIGVGMVDEITDRTWVVIDAVDGRVHYADLGRIEPGDTPHRGMLVALAGDSTLRGKPTSVPRLKVLSEVEIDRLATYDGPTWLDEAIVARFQVQQDTPGFPAELRQALADRGRWLAGRELAVVSGSNEFAPKPDMMRSLRQRETAHLAETLSRQLNAIHVPHEPGSRISGVYERAIATPTGRLAVIRSADTFTLAPWKPALEPLRGRAVLGLVSPSRVMWTLDRGRTLPGRG